MDNLSLGFIYALKERRETTLMDRAIGFLSEYTGTGKEYYTSGEMKRIARMVFIEFLRTARSPAYHVHEFFAHLDRTEDEKEAILESLRMVQVRDDEGYINGFRDMAGE